MLSIFDSQLRAVRTKHPRSQTRRLALEPLENRLLMASFLVTTTSDSGQGSLRWAIEQANARAGADTISFNLQNNGTNRFQDVDSGLMGGDAAADAFVIRPLTALPSLTDPTDGTTIDGRSQTMFGGNTNPFGPEVVLDGSLAQGNPAAGIYLAPESNGNRIFGLNIQGFSGDGVMIVRSDDNWLAGNYIGTDATGTQARPNGTTTLRSSGGILLSAGAQNNLIGSDGNGVNDPLERNVISGNRRHEIRIQQGSATDATIQNIVRANYIGLNAAGQRVPGPVNGDWGVLFVGISGGRGPEQNLIDRNYIAPHAAGDVGFVNVSSSNNTVVRTATPMPPTPAEMAEVSLPASPPLIFTTVSTQPHIEVRDGTLYVIGTIHGDSITIRPSSSVATAGSPTGSAVFLAAPLGSLAPQPLQVTVTNSAGTLQQVRYGASKFVVIGGSGNDRIVNDTDLPSFLYGDTDHDTLIGGSNRDVFVGGPGHDTLNGRGGDDTYRYAGIAHLGVDEILGEPLDGVDTLDFSGLPSAVQIALDDPSWRQVNDLLWLKLARGAIENVVGTPYNDSLVGDERDNTLFGLGGNDGLFGGWGADRLIGGEDVDRFLTLDQDPDEFTDQDSGSFGTFGSSLVGLAGGEVLTWFESPSNGTSINGEAYRAQSWTSSEIILVDQALELIQRHTESSRFLKTMYGHPLRFIRAGDAVDGSASQSGANLGGRITLVQNAFDYGRLATYSTVFHEIGHNWDEEGLYWQEFLELSGWTNMPPGTSGFSKSIDGQWWHANNARFAETYGRENPVEDFATSFEAYFMQRAGFSYIGSPAPGNSAVGAANIPEKIALVRRTINHYATSGNLFAPPFNQNVAANEAYAGRAQSEEPAPELVSMHVVSSDELAPAGRAGRRGMAVRQDVESRFVSTHDAQTIRRGVVARRHALDQLFSLDMDFVNDHYD